MVQMSSRMCTSFVGCSHNLLFQISSEAIRMCLCGVLQKLKKCYAAAFLAHQNRRQPQEINVYVELLRRKKNRKRKKMHFISLIIATVCLYFLPVRINVCSIDFFPLCVLSQLLEYYKASQDEANINLCSSQNSLCETDSFESVARTPALDSSQVYPRNYTTGPALSYPCYTSNTTRQPPHCCSEPMLQNTALTSLLHWYSTREICSPVPARTDTFQSSDLATSLTWLWGGLFAHATVRAPTHTDRHCCLCIEVVFRCKVGLATRSFPLCCQASS